MQLFKFGQGFLNADDLQFGRDNRNLLNNFPYRIRVMRFENVFGNYRGNLDDYRKMCGKEDRVYYEDGDDGEWYVFLKCGVAVDVFEFTRQVFYFIPQNEVSFFKNFSGELKMQKEPPEEDIETFIPAP